MNNPFDIIKAFHTSEWKKISDRDKSRNFFMINRILSIAYPLQTNSFNDIKIRPEKAVDFLKIFTTTHNKRTPQWIWTKTIKKEKEREKKEYNEDVINFIKEKYQISNREIKELKNFFPSKFNAFYKEIETLIS